MTRKILAQYIDACEVLKENGNGKAKAEKIKNDVENYMKDCPLRIQRIIQYKYFEQNTWEETAFIMGRHASGESIRQELRRYMKERGEREKC